MPALTANNKQSNSKCMLQAAIIWLIKKKKTLIKLQYSRRINKIINYGYKC